MNTEFKRAICNNTPYLLDYILKTNPNIIVDKNDNWGIKRASYFGYHEILQILLKYPETHRSYISCLELACKNNRIRCAKILLKEKKLLRSYPLRKLASCIHFSMIYHYCDLVMILIESIEIPVNEMNNHVGYLLVKNDNIRIMREYLRNDKISLECMNKHVIYDFLNNDFIKNDKIMLNLLFKNVKKKYEIFCYILKDTGLFDIRKSIFMKYLKSYY